MGRDEPVMHPGQYVRDSVLTPKKLSVTAAARLVGVGRPAFSKFVNGRVSTTRTMANKIEVAFGISAEKLLEMQGAYEREQEKDSVISATTTPYVVPFLSFKANDITRWIERNISARSRLAVFLRILVNTTGGGLKKVDFPGNDDSETPGWDGYVENPQATRWVPGGVSGWEFGTNKGFEKKAEKDFTKSVKAISSKSERGEITFVFVTPRSWPKESKEKWIEKKQATGQWKDVCVYDSSSLEQWLEQSIPAQVWFANETKSPAFSVYSLDYCWEAWSHVCDPPLIGSFFVSAIDAARRIMISKLSSQTAEPIIVAADSVSEGLAFLSQLFSPLGGAELEQYRDKIIVVNEAGVLPKLALGATNFIAVLTNRDVEVELGKIPQSIRTIALYPRNVINSDPHINLEPVNQDTFTTSLEEMGYSRDETFKLVNESGKSLTVLRRRLSTIPAIRVPEWAENSDVVTSLIPFLFIGSWNSSNKEDQAALEILSDMKYDHIERLCQSNVGTNDSPLWSIGTYRGVVSKIDLLFAIANSITYQDLEIYFEVSKIILIEDDPKLDLPEDKRWAAAIYNKSRDFSAALREGVSETLVLLSVYGNSLFKSRLGFDCERAASKLVRDLLTPITTRKLEANSSDLTSYAEAAPEEFLTILEEDLKSESPEVYGLLRPVSSGIFGGGCPRSDILWALEGLSWKPEILPRTVLILAQLAEIEIDDNWANRPISSLNMIFCIWMPQTAADHDTRLRMLRLLVDKYPNVAWKVCINQIDNGHRFGHYNHKPKWRNDGNGFGEPFKTNAPGNMFRREIIELILNWKHKYTHNHLNDLIKNLHNLSETDQKKVWGLVKIWLKNGVHDSEKAHLREIIRTTVLSRRGIKRNEEIGFSELPKAAKPILQLLEPSSLKYKHEWLFREQWIELSADDLNENESSYEKREEKIRKLRIDALKEIIETNDLLLFFEFVELGKAAWQIGWLTTKEIIHKDKTPEFIKAVFLNQSGSLSWARVNFLRGMLKALYENNTLNEILNVVSKSVLPKDFVHILQLSPFGSLIWRVVDTLSTIDQDVYWSNVVPDNIHNTTVEINESVERLINAGRPRAAFNSVHFSLKVLDKDLLYKLMTALLKEGRDKPGEFQLNPYYIKTAFKLLDEESVLTLEQKAKLEFAYIEVLSDRYEKDDHYGIPNLEKYNELHPDLFIQAIVWTYRRSDQGVDPSEWAVPIDETEKWAKRGYSLLNGLHRVPGYDDSGIIKKDKLAVWVKSVREVCTKLQRIDVADICIGELLSYSPIGKDGVWPCEAVRDVLEEVRSSKIMTGVYTGIKNSEGVKVGEGGTKEREQATKHRKWANELNYSHPFVSSELLQKTARLYDDDAGSEDTRAAIRRRLR